MNSLLPYYAGLFDGEGTVGIYKFNKGDKFYYKLEVQLSNTYLPILYQLKELFGGSVYVDKKNWKNTRLIVGKWTVSASQAVPFIKDIVPYSLIKKEQLLLALEFQKNTRKLLKGKINTPLSACELEYKKECSLRMSELKHLGTKSWEGLQHGR